MAIGAFPIAKLGVLFLKQLSKPIANYAKERAKHHPVFRRYVCIPPARIYNWCEIRARMWIMNLGQPVNVPPMNEAMAIDLGANLLGEGILFAIAAALLLYEYSRQSSNNEKKEQQLKQDFEDLRHAITELNMVTERQRTQMRELFRTVHDIDSRVVKVPWGSNRDTEIESLDIPSHPEIIPQNPVVTDDSVISTAILYIQNNLYRQHQAQPSLRHV